MDKLLLRTPLHQPLFHKHLHLNQYHLNLEQKQYNHCILSQLLFDKVVEGSCHLRIVEKILIKDGFKKGRNKDYPELEPFSELHLTYKELGLNGFGDFLIVGNEYSESGGPAYAVAIHLTYFNEDEIMYIRHFISKSNDTPTDPAGKFAEALAKLVERVEEDDLIFKSDAYRQYKDFHDRGHFPGLGVVKKLSMQHHIETLAQFLE